MPGTEKSNFQLLEQVQDLKHQLSQKKSECDVLSDRLQSNTTEHDEKLKKMREIFGQATIKIDNYRATISSKNNEIEELKEKLKEYKSKQDKNEEDLELNKYAIEKLTKEKDAVDERIRTIENKNQKITEEMNTVRKEYEQYKNRARKLLEKTKEAPNTKKMEEMEKIIQEMEEKYQAECAKKYENQFVLERDLRKAIDHINELEAKQAILTKEKNAMEILTNRLHQSSLQNMSRFESFEQAHEEELKKIKEESQENTKKFQRNIKELTEENQRLLQLGIKEISVAPPISEEDEDLKRQVQELRILLRECQGDNKILKHQERIIKGELRKLNTVDKKENMNIEYLKNVLLKFLLSENKQNMIPIISKLLSLNDAETTSLNNSCIY